MKTLKLSLLTVLGSFLLMSFSTATNSISESLLAAVGITWKAEAHDFGDIKKGTPVSHDFTFKNTTDQTVLITNVKASCGCTATNYTKTPVKPGESASVTATYNAAAPGAFNKTVTVTTNTETKVLTIKGKVIE
ncbi:DUF1573 domain-containing protein [Flavobacterium sp. '19STA2R22 D10 B1']|uniref:DUF1573 domain-containing protein n=1 Tax=Flavobacterium aerium TaxID=3037261 RepID=UPI00278C24F4|nr:DUF1573 domain-containing protein [Flavobacterium sp. '19STA2R22 D10 B1']